MRPALAALRSRLAGMLDSSSARATAALVLLAGTLVLAGSAIGYWQSRELAREKELAAMNLAAADEAERLAEGLESLSRTLVALAADDSISSAVVDSEGRSRHLAPVLRLVETTLVRQFGGQSARQRIGEPAVAVLDYQGRWLLGSPGASAEEFADAPWIREVTQGSPRAHFDAHKRVFYIAQPVIFPATGMAEGVLVAVVRMAGGSVASARSPRWIERVGSAQGVSPLVSDPRYLTVSRRLPLAEPLADLQLFLAIGISNGTLQNDALAILRPHLVVALVGILAAIVLGLVLGRRMGRPLMRVAGTLRASRTLENGAEPRFEASAVGGSSELRLLARTLDDTFGALARSTAQAHLVKSALDAARDGVVIADMRAPDQPLIYVNRAFEDLTGYPAAEVLGRNCRFLHASDVTQPPLDALRDAIRDGRPANALLRNWRKDGTPFWNELSIAPVRDPAGRVTHFVGIQKDVTERVRAEEHLRAAQKLESLGQLTGGLAHDFNNLLGIVIGNLDLLTELLPEGSSERARSDNALQAALRGAAITQSLLAVARRQRLEPQAIDVNERLREMLPLLANTAGRRVRLQAELADGPTPTLVDISGLDAALLNLSINARDAMAESGGTLRLRTSILELPGAVANPEYAELPPGRYVRIDVADSGCGMPDAVRERAFEPFFSTKAPGHGTGLGLAMVYGFARQSGGTAVLQSAPGAGTTASILLPSRPCPEAP